MIIKDLRGINDHEKFNDLNAGDCFLFAGSPYVKSNFCSAYDLLEHTEQEFVGNPLVRRVKATLVIEDWRAEE